MKEINSIKDAAVATIIGIIVGWLICPLVAFSGLFTKRGGTFGWHWEAAILASLTFTLIVLTSFIVFAITKARQRFFQVEVFVIDKISFNDFMSTFKERKNSYIFECFQHTLLLSSGDTYSYTIIKDSNIVKEETFSTLEELLSAKIIFGETLASLWNELEYVCRDSIIKNDSSSF